MVLEHSGNVWKAEQFEFQTTNDRMHPTPPKEEQILEYCTGSCLGGIGVPQPSAVVCSSVQAYPVKQFLPSSLWGLASWQEEKDSHFRLLPFYVVIFTVSKPSRGLDLLRNWHQDWITCKRHLLREMSMKDRGNRAGKDREILQIMMQLGHMGRRWGMVRLGTESQITAHFKETWDQANQGNAWLEVTHQRSSASHQNGPTLVPILPSLWVLLTGSLVGADRSRGAGAEWGL